MYNIIGGVKENMIKIKQKKEYTIKEQIFTIRQELNHLQKFLWKEYKNKFGEDLTRFEYIVVKNYFEKLEEKINSLEENFKKVL